MNNTPQMKAFIFILSCMILCLNNACAQPNPGSGPGNQIRFDGIYRTAEQAYHYHLEGSEPETKYMRSYLRFYADGRVVCTGASDSTIVDSLHFGHPAVCMGKYTIIGDSISFDITDNIKNAPFLFFRGKVLDAGKHLDLEEGTYYNGDRSFGIKYDFYPVKLVEYLNTRINGLKTAIEDVAKGKNATIGVSIVANNLRDTININENLHYPMQSVFKFPIALAVLSEVEKGKLKLDQKIKITSKDLLPDTWSPIRDKYPHGTTMYLAELIRYTVSQSDNNGCDILLQLIGGTAVVEDFLLQNQLPGISIKANEAEMHKDWDTQFQNWATPLSLNNLLIRFWLCVSGNEKRFSDKNTYFLWKMMTETTTGAQRLRGKLPQGTIVAHKTGSSGTNDKNVTAATNDIGIILLPDGSPVFISVLINNSLEKEEINEKIISDIAKIVWDYYTQ